MIYEDEFKLETESESGMYSDWGLVAWWTNISAFANLFWFHNYFKLGPDAGDSVFERYNDSQIFSYVV